MIHEERPTVPAGRSLQEAEHHFLADAGLQGGPARDVWLALARGVPLSDAGRELLRQRATLPTDVGQWAKTAAEHLGVPVHG